MKKPSMELTTLLIVAVTRNTVSCSTVGNSFMDKCVSCKITF